MAKRVTAEGSGPVFRALEQLLALRAERLDSLQGSAQIVDMEVHVHGSPMSLEFAPVGGLGCGLRSRRPFKKAEFCIEALQDSHSGHRFRLLREAERGAVEGYTLCKTRYIDAD